ncbi:MAG: RHS repeat-associated core domain-containing protein [Clostridia bacterium]|nr:RHS repeat-associated core domain-containing protein [Clostridia bacterium]
MPCLYTRTVYTYDAFGKLTQTQNSSFATLQTFDEYERVTSHYCLVDNGIASMNSFTYASNVDDTVTQESVRIASSSVQPIATSYTKDGLQRSTETKVMQGSYGHKYVYSYIPRQTREWIPVEDDGPIITPPILPTAVSPTATGGYWETTTVGTTPYISTFKEYSMSGSTATLVRTDDITYDANGNITQYGNTTYVYDKLNRLTRENNMALDKTIIWSYDVSGNIISRKEYAYGGASLGSPTATYTYTYGNTWKDQLTSFGGKSISYDNAGNPISYGDARMSWSNGRNLASYYVPGDGIYFDMKYSADGKRVEKRYTYDDDSTDETTITYFYNGNNLVCEKTDVGGSVSRKYYLYNSQGIIGFAIGSTVYTYRKNLFGDIVAIYNGSTKVAEYAYDAYGKCTIITDTGNIGRNNPFRYRGYYWDSDLELYYLMSRYYDPATGRFINADSLEYLDPKTIGGLNLYAYCGSNPVSRIDETGCEWEGFVKMITELFNGAKEFIVKQKSLLSNSFQNILAPETTILSNQTGINKVIPSISHDSIYARQTSSNGVDSNESNDITQFQHVMRIISAIGVGITLIATAVTLICPATFSVTVYFMIVGAVLAVVCGGLGGLHVELEMF